MKLECVCFHSKVSEINWVCSMYSPGVELWISLPFGWFRPCAPVRCAKRLWLEQKHEWQGNSAPRYIPCLTADWLMMKILALPFILLLNFPPYWLFLFWSHFFSNIDSFSWLWMPLPCTSLFQSPLIFTSFMILVILLAPSHLHGNTFKFLPSQKNTP